MTVETSNEYYQQLLEDRRELRERVDTQSDNIINLRTRLQLREDQIFNLKKSGDVLLAGEKLLSERIEKLEADSHYTELFDVMFELQTRVEALESVNDEAEYDISDSLDVIEQCALGYFPLPTPDGEKSHEVILRHVEDIRNYLDIDEEMEFSESIPSAGTSIDSVSNESLSSSHMPILDLNEKLCGCHRQNLICECE